MLAAESFASNMNSIFDLSPSEDCGSATIHKLQWIRSGAEEGVLRAAIPVGGNDIEVRGRGPGAE